VTRPVRIRSWGARPTWLDAVARVVLPLAVLVVLVAVWQSYAARAGNFLMPKPGRFVSSIPDVVGSGEAWRSIATSDLSLLFGYGLAIAVGVPLGLSMARNRLLDRVMGPYLDIAIVVPMAVMMPVVLMALGLTRRAQVAVIVLFALPFIVVATRDGARTLRAEWTEMARVFGAGEAQLWRRVLLPGSVAAIVSGLRLGFAQALTGLVTVELTLIALGIGKQMIVYQSHFQSARLFVFVAMLMLQSVVILGGLRLLERRFSRGLATSRGGRAA
jgi:ABC-type nitrate/sulfonate/bicarbonate transport system permease component